LGSLRVQAGSAIYSLVSHWQPNTVGIGMENGLQKKHIPETFGEASPYYRSTVLFVLPAILVAIVVYAYGVYEFPFQERVCHVSFLLGSAYAFGSNAGLFRYAPKMYTTCMEVEYLGKEAFSTIQAALFPEFFALQIASTFVALGGRIGQGATPTETVWGYDSVCLCLSGALLLGLVNLLCLGPLTSRFMVDMYNLCPEGFYGNSQPFSAPLMPNDEAKKRVKMRFGIVHGISMLLNLASLGAVGLSIVLSA